MLLSSQPTTQKSVKLKVTMPKRSVKRKRNTSDIEDTIDAVYSDLDNLLSQRKQQLLEMHEKELQLVERENAYYIAKMDEVRNIEADH